MIVNVFCPVCGLDVTAEIIFDIGATYGGRSEELVDFAWLEPDAETGCHCPRTDDLRDYLIYLAEDGE